MRRILMFLIVLLTATTLFAGGWGKRQIGEEIQLRKPVVSAAVEGMAAAREGNGEATVWLHELRYEGAEYIAPHFSSFDLPAGARLIVRSPDGSRSWTYTGRGKDLADPSRGFWGIHIYGEVAVIELRSRIAVDEGAVVIDRFARGFRPDEMEPRPVEPRPITSQAICGSDDSQWAKCYETSEPAAYEKAKAVARLLIGGTSACTGWLVGSEGHVMTNEHCISTSSAAGDTNYEFMAEGSTCSTACDSWGACPGTVVATSGSLVKVNAALDYTLIKLPVNPTSTYGYLQMRNSDTFVGERIYIPQHPQAWGKKIALKAGSGDAKIDTVTASGCSSRNYYDLGYAADTQGGSSGSPVLSYADNSVIGLHHCGSCPNRAVPITKVIADLGTAAPLNSIAGGSSCTDSDGDGYCSTSTGGTDCNDGNSSIYPSAPESCDGLDNDCDGTVDEGCPTGGGISLTASGYKVKGQKRVDLSWSGASSTSVDVFRNGSKITTTANDGAYTDAMNTKGGGTYTYKVCEAGTSTCSNEATVSF